MDKIKLEISDLLALRDGEPRDADLSADDPRVAERLLRMQALRSELQALPDIPISEDTWQRVSAASRRGGAGASVPGPWLRFPLATAASVFFAFLLGIYLSFSGQPRDLLDGVGPQMTNTEVQLEPSGLHLASLMNRSRDLEMRLQGRQALSRVTGTSVLPSTSAPPQPSLVERRLMGRLADVDAQIALMFDSDIQDPRQRERLWAQRVNLLESLVAVRGIQADARFEDSRSM